MTRHAQIPQYNKFAISLEYLNIEVSDKIDNLNADKHNSFLQIHTMILDGQAFPKFQK